MAAQSDNLAEELFAGGGEMGARMRALDWSKTPLGPVETWPQSLKTSVSICLNSRFGIRICWGPELVMLYNDAYISVACGKHPDALGSRVRDTWPELWETIGPMLNGVMERGEATWADDLLLPMERNGYAEECYFTFSYSPIRDESGGVGGVFTPVTETTEKVIGRRRLNTLRKLAAISGRKSTSAQGACVVAAQELSCNPYDLPFAAIYLFDSERKCAMLAASTAENPASKADERRFASQVDSRDEGWLPFGRLHRGETCTLGLSSGIAIPLPENPWGISPTEAIAVPIAHLKSAEPLGFLLAGVNVRKRLDEEYREFYAQIAEQLASTIWQAEALERETALRLEAETERAKLRDTFMNAPAAIAILSGPKHILTLVNQRYVRLVGRESAADLIRKPLIEAMPELAGQGIIELLDQVYRTGVPIVGNERPIHVRRAGGSAEEGYFNFVYQPDLDAHGQVVEGILVLAIDVTEQVLGRRQVETREEQFRVLANSIPQLAWMGDADGVIFWYNRRWYEYTGATQEQMKGTGTEFVHPEFLANVLARYNRSMETGEPFDMTFPLRGADGTFRSFLSRALPVRDSTGKIVRWFGTNTDVEGQQKAELALRQSEKLAAVGRLASSIAHEINNPLEAVINLIYLARSAAVNEDTRVYLNSAEQELARVSQITNQTLRFHKQQSAAAPTDIVELLDSILTLYRGKLMRDGIQLQLETSECEPLICYAGEIRQVVANLVGNALDAMPRGGILRMRVRPGCDWRHRAPGIRITIADTGHGMPPEIRKRIYEPFFTTKGETGTGLGLWVSAGIVDSHGGSMHVSSSNRLGASGTVFTVIFPHGRVIANADREEDSE